MCDEGFSPLVKNAVIAGSKFFFQIYGVSKDMKNLGEKISQLERVFERRWMKSESTRRV